MRAMLPSNLKSMAVANVHHSDICTPEAWYMQVSGPPITGSTGTNGVVVLDVELPPISKSASFIGGQLFNAQIYSETAAGEVIVADASNLQAPKNAEPSPFGSIKPDRSVAAVGVHCVPLRCTAEKSP